jgi:hypothetical protein
MMLLAFELKLKGRKVDTVQCQHRNGTRLQGRTSTGPTISIIATRRIKFSTASPNEFGAAAR